MNKFTRPDMKQAGRDLDCLIAKRAGWSDIKLHNYAEWYGVPPEGGKSLRIPYYSSSVDAALTLPFECALELFFDGKRWSSGWEEADKLALLLCGLWWDEQ